VTRSAIFDPTGAYRYSLTRLWEPSLPRLCFVMLNPSTADAERDDPTIRRCVGFARWGYGGLEVVNLYAFRATRPDALFRAPDPIGPENDRHIREAVARAALVVAAWGNHGAKGNRGMATLPLLTEVYCLGMTALREPRHPLYTAKDARTIPYQPPLFHHAADGSRRHVTDADAKQAGIRVLRL
jgi:hypothetical protein